MAVDLGVNNTEQVAVPLDGAFHLAPFGTALPTTESTALNTAFGSVGWIGENAPKLRIGRELVEIKAWQRRAAIARRLKTWDIGVKLEFIELAYNTIDAALGGSTLSTVSTGHYKVVPAQIPTEYSAILDMQAATSLATYNYRFVFPKVTLKGDEIPLDRDKEIKLAVDCAILELEDSAEPFYILTDDPDFQSDWSEGDPG